MNVLTLPHRPADYLCPVNGLCDIYEWKTGRRIPEELLFFSRIGFQMISNQRSWVPKMLFLSHSGIGRQLLEFWQEPIGYQLHCGEGKSFKTALAEIKELLDRKIPVILFGLDMYYLPFHTGFYHEKHIPGHVVLMVGSGDDCVYVHDNSKAGLQVLPFADLQAAWAAPYLNLSRGNCYFGVDMNNPDGDISAVLARGFKRTARLYLSPPVSFMGMKGFARFLEEYPGWMTAYPPEVLRRIYLHVVEFTGSVLPGIPEVLGGSPLGFANPHQAGRDRFAAALLKYQVDFGTQEWAAAAGEAVRSGRLIEAIAEGFTADLVNRTFTDHSRYLALFAGVKAADEAIVRSFA